MAYMSPDMYRGVLNKANKLIGTIKTYLDGRTPDGLIIPITLKTDIEKMILECESTKASLLVAIKGLKQASPKRAEYQCVFNKICNAQRDMRQLDCMLLNAIK